MVAEDTGNVENRKSVSNVSIRSVLTVKKRQKPLEMCKRKVFYGAWRKLVFNENDTGTIW